MKMRHRDIEHEKMSKFFRKKYKWTMAGTMKERTIITVNTCLSAKITTDYTKKATQTNDDNINDVGSPSLTWMRWVGRADEWSKTIQMRRRETRPASAKGMWCWSDENNCTLNLWKLCFALSSCLCVVSCNRKEKINFCSFWRETKRKRRNGLSSNMPKSVSKTFITKYI